MPAGAASHSSSTAATGAHREPHLQLFPPTRGLRGGTTPVLLEDGPTSATVGVVGRSARPLSASPRRIPRRRWEAAPIAPAAHRRLRTRQRPLPKPEPVRPTD